MNLAWSPTKVLVTGCSGTGKTLFWSRYLQGAPARWRFIFDHDGQLSHRFGVAAINSRQGLERSAESGWCIFDPVQMFPGDAAAGFEWFCTFAMNASKRLAGRKVFACDEVQSFVGSRSWPKPFAAILQTGRVYEIDAAFIAVSPNVVHAEVRNQATEVVAFQTTSEPAVRFLESEWGFLASELRSLPRFHFIARRKGGGEVRGVIRP
jgi:hypothetical protein